MCPTIFHPLLTSLEAEPSIEAEIGLSTNIPNLSRAPPEPSGPRTAKRHEHSLDERQERLFREIREVGWGLDTRGEHHEQARRYWWGKSATP